MNPILLILALLFLIPIIKEIRILILIKWYSKKVVGKITSIESKETFTNNLNKIFLGGNHRLIKISYQFIFQGKKWKIINEDIHVSALSHFSKLKKEDNIDVYVSLKNNEIKNTWLIKNSFIKLIPFLTLFLLLLIVSYLSSDMQ